MDTYHIPLGSHLYSPRFGYDHHGIYVGLGKVIHHSGWSEAFKKGPIECTSIEDFCAGNGFKIKLYDSIVYSPPEIVMRARRRLRAGNTKYNLLFSNCEHFATWCVTGMESSEQVQEAAKKTISAGVATFAARKATQKTTEHVIARAVGRAAVGGYAGAKVGTLAGGATVAFTGAAGVAIAPALPLVIAGAAFGSLLGFILDD